MATTYQLISSVTVGSGGASSIDFTSIPATYTDLLLKFSGNFTNGLDVIVFQFNGSATSYTARYLRGSGSATASYTEISSGVTKGFLGGYASSDTNTFSNTELYIPNYAGNTNKSISGDGVQEANATTAYTFLGAGLWSNTAAITSIKITSDASYTIKQYSTAYLYGIKNS